MFLIILYIILVLLIVIHLVWYLLSYGARHKRLANETVVWNFLQQTFRDLNIHVDLNRLEQNWIPSYDNTPLRVAVLPFKQGAPTFVFVPGTAAHVEIYIEFLYALNDRGFNVVCYDPRGHGRSGGLRGDFSVEELVQDALVVGKYAKDRFGGKLAISGSSQGGITAFYAVAQSDIFDVAACNNIADLTDPESLTLSKFHPPRWMVPYFVRLFLGPYKHYVVPLSFYLNFKAQKMNTGEDAAHFLQRDPLAVIVYTLGVLGSLASSPMAKPPEEITLPMLVFQGSKDIVFPLKYTEHMFSRLNCPKELMVFEGMEHLVLTNRVPEVIGPISDWLHKNMT
jgi:alpha-beta hydrolase superfamily lysophospholipase